MPALRILPWPLLSASLVVGLAALLRMTAPAEVGHAADPTQIIRLPRPMTRAILTVFLLAAVALVLGVARRLRSRRGEDGMLGLRPEGTRIPLWLRTLIQFASLLNVLILAYLVWRGVIPLADLLALATGAGSIAAPGSDAAPASAPPLVTWGYGLLALAAGLGALGIALWMGFGDRVAERLWRTRRGAPDEAPAARAEPDDDPRAERDPRRAIVRCYARFARVAEGSGVAPRPWLTPMEFMRETLGRLPSPSGAVPALTGLFELARFSHHALGPAERERALDALDRITAAAARGDDDAARS